MCYSVLLLNCSVLFSVLLLDLMASQCNHTMDVGDMLINKIHLVEFTNSTCRQVQLATYLGKNKQNPNITKCAGSSLTVGGALVLTTAGAVTLLTCSDVVGAYM